jgi:hypothetical protein
LEACGVLWDCVSEWACAPPQPARSKASMTTIVKVFTGARTLSFRAPTPRLLRDVLRRSSTRVGGSPIWSRTNSSTCWCHLAGSPKIAGAHSREDGDVRGAVHYGTFSHEEPPFETPSSSELLRIPIPRSWVNKDSSRGAESFASGPAPCLVYCVVSIGSPVTGSSLYSPDSGSFAILVLSSVVWKRGSPGRLTSSQSTTVSSASAWAIS